MDDAGTDGVSHTNQLSIGSGALFDLRDNDLVIDYSGGTPIGNTSFPSNSIARYLQDGYGTGNWSGSTGIVTSVGGTGSLASAIGYAEATDIGSPGTFNGISIDSTAVLVKYTFFGDSNLDGETDISDFAVLSGNFNRAQLWYGGDYNYDGVANIADFSLQSASFNLSGRRGPGLNYGKPSPRSRRRTSPAAHACRL